MPKGHPISVPRTWPGHRDYDVTDAADAELRAIEDAMFEQAFTLEDEAHRAEAAGDLHHAADRRAAAERVRTAREDRFETEPATPDTPMAEPPPPPPGVGVLRQVDCCDGSCGPVYRHDQIKGRDDV